MRMQKLEGSDQESPSAPESILSNEGNRKKRKASEDEDTIRKRTKAANDSSDELSNTAATPVLQTHPIKPLKNGVQIPSRPATPLKSVGVKPNPPAVDEDEWAAFEADIEATEASAAATYDDGVISAPAMSTAELAKKEGEENRIKREQQDAEVEGDKEDAARRMEEELEEIEGLERRVKKLKDMREALRQKSKAGLELAEAGPPLGELRMHNNADKEEDDEDDDEEDDEWDGFRMKG